MPDLIRVGRISSINYEAGTARVLYTDRDNSVSTELPFLSYEYFMPEVDDLVFVLHLPNGTENGLILGRAWNDTLRPPEGEKGVYRKDFSNKHGEAYIRFDGDALTIKTVGNIKIEAGKDIVVNGKTINLN